jgi:hypothetical protein
LCLGLGKTVYLFDFPGGLAADAGFLCCGHTKRLARHEKMSSARLRCKPVPDGGKLAPKYKRTIGSGHLLIWPARCQAYAAQQADGVFVLDKQGKPLQFIGPVVFAMHPILPSSDHLNVDTPET